NGQGGRVVRLYFFDFVTQRQTLHDFEGRKFSSRAEAGEYAKLLAIHLQYAPGAQYRGWSVLVRDMMGHKIHSVAVPEPERDVVPWSAPSASPWFPCLQS